ncbi:hypothetical protein MKW94_016385, partial [Papaver nudicaule]|nr:hypothetical protein [Papaver nudicaule]
FFSHNLDCWILGTISLKESKPVYISVSCNLSAITHPNHSFGLEAAVEAAAEFLNKAVKPVMVAGPKLRVIKGCDAFLELADACGYPVAVMPSAKGLVKETHPHFIGTYWGAVSTSFCAEIVESADAYIFAGPIFNDYSSVGYSLLLKKKAIIVQPDRVVIANGPAFGCALMKEFLPASAKKLKRNTTAYENYHRIYIHLRVNILFKHVQKMLSGDSAMIAETEITRRVRVRNLHKHHIRICSCFLMYVSKWVLSLQYRSIGWSVGATLGYAQAAKDKRVIACIGDGSFQVTAQDISTMLRCEQNTIIFLINNGGYTIEDQVDNFAEKAMHEMKKQYVVFDAKVLKQDPLEKQDE